MQILNLVQGSPEWKAERAVNYTASEAPAMKGDSKYQKRDELLHAKKTGEEKEFDDFTLKLFEKGHKIEALARPIAEKIIGEQLFPCTGKDVVDGLPLLASFDGLTMDQRVAWECKSWNEEKAAHVRSDVLPLTDFWQVIQQLVLSKAEKLLYMVTDGTPEKTVYIWVELEQAETIELLSGWKQFEQDLKGYIPEETKTQGVASAIMELPALNIQIDGNVKSSNLAIYKASAEQFIASINTDLKTDDDFATAEKTVKFCETAEARLEQVKGQALEQTADISELFKTINFLKEQIREKRLLCSNAVKSKKAEIKLSIATAAKNDFIEFQNKTNENLGGNYAFVESDFNSAMKGKKTIASLQSAANDEVANCKVKLSALAQKIQDNLEMIPNEWEFLFADKAQIITKENDDFQLLVNARIDSKKEADRIALEAKIEAEAEEKRKQDAENLKSATLAEGGTDLVEAIEDEGEKMSVYPDDDKTLDIESEIKKKVEANADNWKVIASSLQENGIGLKSANKIARLICEGKVKGAKFTNDE